MSTSSHPEHSLGEVLAEETENLGKLGEIPLPQLLGILLLSDFFAHPDRLGGSGDVRPVWRAFAERLRWVAEVRGNHDDIGDNAGQMAEFCQETNAHLLDRDIASLDGLRVAGIGGANGDARRPGRKDMADHARRLETCHLFPKLSRQIFFVVPFLATTPGHIDYSGAASVTIFWAQKKEVPHIRYYCPWRAGPRSQMAWPSTLTITRLPIPERAVLPLLHPAHLQSFVKCDQAWLAHLLELVGFEHTSLRDL